MGRSRVELAVGIFVILGALALAYGGFSYTSETHEAKLGPVEIAITEKQRVNVPVWAGVAFLVVGGGLLLSGKK